MAQFSSRPPFNDDPMPWLDAGGWRSSMGQSGVKSYDPRPEFDRPQHNPTNLILVELRENKRDIYDLMLDLDSLWVDQFTYAERDHALRVLERLAYLLEERRHTKGRVK